MGCQPSSTPATDAVGKPRGRHPRRRIAGTSTDDARNPTSPTVWNPMVPPSQQAVQPRTQLDGHPALPPGPSDHTNRTATHSEPSRGGHRIEVQAINEGSPTRGFPLPFGVPPTEESDFFQSVRESTPVNAMSSGILADDDVEEDSISHRGIRNPHNGNREKREGEGDEESKDGAASSRSASRASSRGSEASSRSYGMASNSSSIIDESCDPFEGGVAFASKVPARVDVPSPQAEGAPFPTASNRNHSTANKRGRAKEREVTSPTRCTEDLKRDPGTASGGGGAGGGRKIPSPSISIFEFQSFRASLMLSQRHFSISGVPTTSSSDRSRIRCRTLDTPLGSAEDGAVEHASGVTQRDVEDAFGEQENDRLLGPLLDSMLASVSVDDLLKGGVAQQQPETSLVLAGSTSTARLSVNSASTANSSSDDDDEPHGAPRRVRASSGSGGVVVRSEGEESSSSAMYAFNSLSVLAPHAARDRIDIKKRLKGGYTDIVLGVRVHYPTPRERRLAREHELQHEARSREVLCPGRGLLWSHPSVQEGLPCPLELLERSYEREPLFVNNPPWYTDVRCRGRILQFLFTLQQFLPSLMAELTNTDRLGTKSVSVAITMVEEFVAVTHRDTCRHVRIRILLTQLLVQLRDTIVLLEEPERFLQEFSKVNEAELIDLMGDVSLSQQTTDQATEQDLTLLFQALKRHQANLFLYVLLMIDNCVWMSAVDTRQHRDISQRRT